MSGIELLLKAVEEGFTATTVLKTALTAQLVLIMWTVGEFVRERLLMSLLEGRVEGWWRRRVLRLPAPATDAQAAEGEDAKELV